MQEEKKIVESGFWYDQLNLGGIGEKRVRDAFEELVANPNSAIILIWHRTNEYREFYYHPNLMNPLCFHVEHTNFDECKCNQLLNSRR